MSPDRRNSSESSPKHPPDVRHLDTLMAPDVKRRLKQETWKVEGVNTQYIAFLLESSNDLTLYLGRGERLILEYCTMLPPRDALGYGSFGLPHTDEDFYNKDLGNCMD